MDGWQPQAFLVCAAATVTLQLACFVVAYVVGFDKITDLAGYACPINPHHRPRGHQC
jgi:hypothetical protein